MHDPDGRKSRPLPLFVERIPRSQRLSWLATVLLNDCHRSAEAFGLEADLPSVLRLAASLCEDERRPSVPAAMVSGGTR